MVVFIQACNTLYTANGHLGMVMLVWIGCTTTMGIFLIIASTSFFVFVFFVSITSYYPYYCYFYLSKVITCRPYGIKWDEIGECRAHNPFKGLERFFTTVIKHQTRANY